MLTKCSDQKGPKRPRYNLWTFPVMVEGPFGVVTAAELIGIIIFIIYAIWSFGIYDFQKISALLRNVDYTTETDKWYTTTIFSHDLSFY